MADSIFGIGFDCRFWTVTIQAIKFLTAISFLRTIIAILKHLLVRYMVPNNHQCQQSISRETTDLKFYLKAKNIVYKNTERSMLMIFQVGDVIGKLVICPESW